MSKKIYRYSLDKRETKIELPSDFEILKVAIRRESELSVWIMLNPEEELTDSVTFSLIRTNEDVPLGMEYLDTIEVEETDFIYHVFVKLN